MFVHDYVQTVFGRCQVQRMTALPTTSQKMLENETCFLHSEGQQHVWELLVTGSNHPSFTETADRTQA